MSEPMVPARLLDDARANMEALRQQHVAAWNEADRLTGVLKRLVEPAPESANHSPLDWMVWAKETVHEALRRG